MDQATDVANRRPLPPHVFHILLSLLEGEGHGYAILKDIGERTDGEMKLGTSTLYAALQRLVRDGLLEEAEGSDSETGKGPPRKVFRITASGRQVARAEARRIQRLSRAVAESGLFEGLAAEAPGEAGS